MADDFVIRFYSPVNEASIGSLMKAVDQKVAGGATQFTVLISTSGGSVFHGLTAYNYLKGNPAQVTTHNIGSVDSIGVALFCAGQRRISVPQARFLLHPVSMNFRDGASYEEPKLMELVRRACAWTWAIAPGARARDPPGPVSRGRRSDPDPVGQLIRSIGR